ncbi:MAG TPA: hypothetical protein VEX15_10245 [Nocardioidaceae bacterium]|nr:hypothetical protein [Nocardioidaceae bacterium]
MPFPAGPGPAGPPVAPPPGRPAPPPQQPPAAPARGPYTETETLAAAAVKKESDQRRSGIVAAAMIAALIGALAALGYAGFALTLRRGIYADLDDDPTSVSKDDAESSDNLNAIGLWVAGVLIGIAFLLLIMSIVSARRGRNGLGITAIVLIVLGGLAATWACLLVNGVDDITEAGDAVTGYLVAGPAFAVMGIGLLLGLLGLRKPAKPASTKPAARAPFPQGPYGGQQGPYGQQPPPSPYAGGPPQYGSQGGNPYGR